MRADRTFFVHAPRKDARPKNPWIFRGFMTLAILIMAELAQAFSSGGFRL
jgi:hypothetical protein